MNLSLNQDTALVRGVRTAIQAVVGFAAGLVLAVWKVPGVPETVHNYVNGHIGQLLLSVGIPAALGAGIMGFIWNALRSDVKNV